MDRISVVLADDQQLFAESLKLVLESRAEFISVVGIASNGKEAVELVRKHRPDIALLDIRMPEMDGVEATAIIRRSFPQTQVVILTTYDDDVFVHSALSEGAVGYLLKQTKPSNLVVCLMAVKEGSVMISPQIARKLVKQLTTPGGRMLAADQAGWLNELTRREKEVLLFLSQGFSNGEIAEKICVEEQSVCNYVSRLYAKIGIHDRIELILLMNKRDLSPAPRGP